MLEEMKQREIEENQRRLNQEKYMQDMKKAKEEAKR